MSDDTTPTNVFPFPRLGFTLTPTTVPGPPDAAATSGATTPDWDAVTVTNSTRRSPLDTLAALPSPGILTPAHAPGAPAGHVPDTFRNTPANPSLVGPRLGALSLAACLAVAVAALRGTHTVLSTWWENRQARTAESAPLREARAKHQAAMQAIGDKAAEQRAKASSKVPSSAEFGRKTLGGGGRSGGSGSSGRSGGSGKSSGSGGSSGGKPTKRPGAGTGGSSGGRGSSGHASSGRGKAPLKTPGGHGSKNSKKTPTNTATGGRKNTTPGKPAPGRGKSPSSPSTSPAMERGRRRQERNDKRQAARLKRKADRQAARLKDRAKDHDADRTRKDAAKDARRDARAKARTARAETRRAKKDEKKADPSSLGNAVRKEAARRLKKRRKTLTPILSKAKKPKAPKAKGKDTAEKTSPPKGKGGEDKAGSPKGKKPAGGKSGTAGTKPRRKKTSRIRWGKGKGRRTRGTGGRRFPGGMPGPGATSTPPPGGGGTRRSPFESAAHATPTTYTVTSEHVPGSTTKPWEPDALTTGTPALPATGPATLDAAPTATFPRPGTTRPKEVRPMPPAPARTDPRIVKARNQAARTGHQVITQSRHMAAEHETEITLDDAIDEYGDFKDDAFKTHSQCMKLAGRARTLRNTLIVFAEELATRHNLIGDLFSGAMARLAESMDLLARMADEMQTSSLGAAEMAEAADNDLNDAYRPYNTATADAGLSVPSAPIHNET